MLSEKIISRYVDIRKELEKIRTTLDTYEGILGQIVPITHGKVDFTKKLKEHNKKHEGICDKFEPLSKEVKKKIQDRTLSEKFGLISYFSALYCVLQLSLIAFKDYYTLDIHFMASILVLNIPILISLVILILKDHRRNWFKETCNWSHTGVIKWFLIFVIVAINYYLWAPIDLISNDYKAIVFNSTIFSSYFIPTLHFITYFIIATLFAQFDAGKLRKRFIEFNTEFEEVKNGIDEFNKLQNEIQFNIKDNEAEE